MNKNYIIKVSDKSINAFWQLAVMRKDFPSYFTENAKKISCCYTFPYSIWDNESFSKKIMPFEEIDAFVNRLIDNNISLYLNFLNTKLNQSHFFDRYSNLIIEIAKNADLHAFINSEELASFLKEKYPYIKTIKPIMSNTAVLPQFDMRLINKKTLNAMKSEIKNPLEYILQVNSYCFECGKCADIKSENKLNFECSEPPKCDNTVTDFEESRESDLFISNEEIEELSKEGFQNYFIVNNKTNLFDEVEALLYYLVKPQFRDEIRLKIIKMFYK